LDFAPARGGLSDGSRSRQTPALEEGWFVKAKGESFAPVIFSTATTVYPIIP
jgi:hypothetical protein